VDILMLFRDISLEEAVCLVSSEICFLVAMDIIGSLEDEHLNWNGLFHEIVRHACQSRKYVEVSELCVLHRLEKPKDVAESLKLAVQKPHVEVYDACLMGDRSCWNVD
jgi:hypothetical protein